MGYERLKTFGLSGTPEGRNYAYQIHSRLEGAKLFPAMNQQMKPTPTHTNSAKASFNI